MIEQGSFDKGPQEIYYNVLRKEYNRQRELIHNPSPFLEELKGYIAEPNDAVLQNILADEIHLKRVWGSILLLTSQLREKNDSRWEQCEPVIRYFWQRVEPVVFRRDDSLTKLLKGELYKSIFGEEVNNE